MNKSRKIIIGLDGVPFGLLQDLMDRGIMDRTREMIPGGVFRKMRSSLPEVSSVAWSSIITGKNPAEHGIFGFTDLSPHSYELRFPDFDDLQSPPFWNQASGRSVIVNVPSTYPVKKMNGVHISGFISIEIGKSVFPQSLIPILKKFDYRLDVDSTLAHKSMDLFLKDLEANLQGSIRAYRYLWEQEDWESFMFVFTGTDRLLHFLWEAYENRDHKYHQDFLDYFQKIDQIIGEIESRTRAEDVFILLSDHGFEGLDHDVYINALLKREGFLKFKSGKEHELIHIDPATRAFAMDPARIYVHEKGKYPEGGVDKRDKERVLQDLRTLFAMFEVEGRRVIRDIYRKEEIYSGPFMDRAPDLVLVGGKGFNLKGNIRQEKLTSRDIFTGKHSQDDAVLFVKGKIDLKSIAESPDVCDVVPIIL